MPKKLVGRVRGNEPHAIIGSSDRTGIEVSQGGRFDDNLLCSAHEAMLGAADDYAVRFCRDYVPKGKVSDSGKSLEIYNPKPSLLVDFAYSLVWRQAVSKDGFRHGLSLGPYLKKLENHLFRGIRTELQLLVAIANMRDNYGKPIEIGLSPYRRRLHLWNVWHSQIGGLDIFLKTDQRAFPKAWNAFLANDNNPLTCPIGDPIDINRAPLLKNLLENMRAMR